MVEVPENRLTLLRLQVQQKKTISSEIIPMKVLTLNHLVLIVLAWVMPQPQTIPLWGWCDNTRVDLHANPGQELVSVPKQTIWTQRRFPRKLRGLLLKKEAKDSGAGGKNNRCFHQRHDYSIKMFRHLISHLKRPRLGSAEWRGHLLILYIKINSRWF